MSGPDSAPQTPGEPAREPMVPRPAPKRPEPATKAKPEKRRRRGGPLRLLARLFGAVLGLGLLGGAIGLAALFAGYQHFSRDLPDVEVLRSYQPRVMSRVYASDARLIAELATERRIFVPVSAIPPMVKQAFLSAEDQNFWTHRGIDPVAIARAVITDIQQYGQGRRPVGASTITQQVAKNILLDNSLSIARKARELILAIRIEQSLSKERILELYLNEIYLGLQAYGVAAAAQSYFNKSLDELTLPEAAFLAALPKAPGNYNPFRKPEAAKARRDWVIDRMAEDRVITPEQATAAKATPISPSPFRRPETVAGGDWFGEEVRRQLVKEYGADTTTQGGLMVRTSLEPNLQMAADRALRDGLQGYDRKQGWRGPLQTLDSGPALRSTWTTILGQLPRPAGMLVDWRLAVVLEATETEAKVGWLERNPERPLAPPLARTGSLLLSDLAWARLIKDGRTGGAPRRIADVVQPGDVVMIEAAPRIAAAPASAATTPQGRNAPPQQPATRAVDRPDRVVLRQVPLVQGALVSLDVNTGRILAMVGGWSFEMSQFNRVTQAQRQPGSSFKPFVYLTALSKGISPSQKFLDAPFVVDQGAGGRWRPGNFGLDFSGPVTLTQALTRSLNLVTVRVADRVGMESVARTAIAFHVVDNMPRVLPAALGAVETTVLRMAGAYASIASGGKEVIPSLIDSIQDRDGKVIWRPQSIACDGCANPAAPPSVLDNRAQIADPASVYQLNLMLQSVVSSGTGHAAGVGLNRQIGGKTGTSQDFNDVWFIGFTADLVTAVWIGYDLPATLGSSETGGSTAAPIWRQFMQTALKDRPVLTFKPPSGLNIARVDGNTLAFKQDQVPGASQNLGDEDTGDGTQPATPQAGTPQAGTPQAGTAPQAGQSSQAAATPGATPGPAAGTPRPGNAATPPTRPATPAGGGRVDSSLGAVY